MNQREEMGTGMLATTHHKLWHLINPILPCGLHLLLPSPGAQSLSPYVLLLLLQTFRLMHHSGHVQITTCKSGLQHIAVMLFLFFSSCSHPHKATRSSAGPVRAHESSSRNNCIQSCLPEALKHNHYQEADRPKSRRKTQTAKHKTYMPNTKRIHPTLQTSFSKRLIHFVQLNKTTKEKDPKSRL
jgi:hypothetical protein